MWRWTSQNAYKSRKCCNKEIQRTLTHVFGKHVRLHFRLFVKIFSTFSTNISLATSATRSTLLVVHRWFTSRIWRTFTDVANYLWMMDNSSAGWSYIISMFAPVVFKHLWLSIETAANITGKWPFNWPEPRHFTDLHFTTFLLQTVGRLCYTAQVSTVICIWMQI